MFANEKFVVQFEGIQERYFLDRKYLHINYFFNKEYKPTSKDWIGIFPRGWREFDQMILGDYIHPRTIGTKDTKISFQLLFNFSENKMTCFNADYQLVYVNADFRVLGRSPFFRLYRTSEEKGESVVYESKGTANVNYATVPKCQELVPMNVPSSEIRNCRQKWEEITKELKLKPASNFVKQSYPSPSRFRKPFGSNSPQQSALPDFQKNYAAARCDFCQRTNELMNEKQILSSQVKNLAECNYDLRKNVTDLQNELELSLAAQRSLKLQLCRLTFQLESYENVTKALVDNLQGYLPVCIDDEGSEIMVQRVNPEMERKLMQYTSRPSHQNERYLKAIIGSQEHKIQDLTKRLLELELPSNGNESNVCDRVVYEENTTEDRRIPENGQKTLNKTE